MKVFITQLCPGLCDPMDYRLPGSSVHEISQARILEWVAISFSRGSSSPWDRTQAFSHCRRILYCLSHQESSWYGKHPLFNLLVTDIINKYWWDLILTADQAGSRFAPSHDNPALSGTGSTNTRTIYIHYKKQGEKKYLSFAFDLSIRDEH